MFEDPVYPLYQLVIKNETSLVPLSVTSIQTKLI